MPTLLVSLFLVSRSLSCQSSRRAGFRPAVLTARARARCGLRSSGAPKWRSVRCGSVRRRSAGLRIVWRPSPCPHLIVPHWRRAIFANRRSRSEAWQADVDRLIATDSPRSRLQETARWVNARDPERFESVKLKPAFVTKMTVLATDGVSFAVKPIRSSARHAPRRACEKPTRIIFVLPDSSGVRRWRGDGDESWLGRMCFEFRRDGGN